ncbi:MAG: hypothetical protein NT150_14105 [Bacteroidetes bacterium]|nr:hypothetical protein [Bacteroidota bacterium]
MKLKLLSLIALLNTCLAFAFTPAIYTYTTKDYDGRQDNTSAVFDGEGLLYVANAYGVLEYDGYKWIKIQLPAGKSPVSLCVHDKKIFVGGNDEIGYVSRDAAGVSSYHSLLPLLADSLKKQIGWMNYCVESAGKIYFVTDQRIFIYDGKAVTMMKPRAGGKFSYLGKHNGQLFLFEKGRGLAVYENENFNWFQSDIKNLEIRGVEKMTSKLYYLYATDGIYKFDGVHAERIEKTAFLAKEAVNRVVAGKDQKVICTELGGVYILDDQFDVKFHFNQSNSHLTTNYVYDAAENKQGDLCLATDNGISIVNLSSAVSNIDISSNLYGAGLSSLLLGDTMYLGTSQGLFFAPNWKAKGEKKFVKIPGVKAFVYDIHVQNGALFCGNRSDVYKINGASATVISPESYRGAWGIHSVPGRKDMFLVGTYSGIDVYQVIDYEWVFSHKMEGYNSPAMNLELDAEGNIWVASGLSGFFKLHVDDDFSKVLATEEFCAKLKENKDYFIELIKVENAIYVSSHKGLYKVEKGDLVKDEYMNSLGLPFERIRKINDQLIYTLQNKTPILLKKGNSGFVIDTAHILNNINAELIGNSELIDKISQNDFLAGTSEGFIIANNASPKKYYGNIAVRRIENIFSGKAIEMLADKGIVIPFSENNLRFTFAYSPLERFYDVEWYVMLEEDGKGQWTKVENAHVKEFSNLLEGDYIFRLKVVCRYTALDETSVAFTVLPPWYRTTLAKIIYFLLLLGGAYLAYLYSQRKLEKVTDKMTEEKERELQEQGDEFKAELLKKELQEKENEISFMALNYSQKRELMESVSDKLNDLLGKLDDPRALRVEIKGVINSLNNSEGDEELKWQEFQIHFNKEHNHFLEKIKEMDPKIKESVLLMCTYIRMGKSNKDICNLLNISINALDKRKSRLREKFNIPEEITVNEYLRQL